MSKDHRFNCKEVRAKPKENDGYALYTGVHDFKFQEHL